jgi:hypothetical protein
MADPLLADAVRADTVRADAVRSDPLHTVMVERLGCRWPIIQTAMGWVAEPSLVIGSSNAGAFGFLGAAVMTPDH